MNPEFCAEPNCITLVQLQLGRGPSGYGLEFIPPQAPLLCCYHAFWHGVKLDSLLQVANDPYLYAIDPTGEPQGDLIVVRLLAGGTLSTARLRCLGRPPAGVRERLGLGAPTALIRRQGATGRA